MTYLTQPRYQNEVDKEIKGVDSRDEVMFNEALHLTLLGRILRQNNIARPVWPIKFHDNLGRPQH